MLVLRHFLYLNEPALDSYLGVVEGGLSDEMTRRSKHSGGRGGEAGIGLGRTQAKVSGQREDSEEDERRIRDTPEQRFDRLMRALDQDPDAYGYEDVLDLADALGRLSVGSLLTLDCEVEVPQAARILSRPDELSGMLNMMEALRPFASIFGQDAADLPSQEQTEAMRKVSQVVRSDVVIVGHVGDDAPRVAGRLDNNFIREMPEGEARVIGKVARRWSENEEYPLLALPGASLLTRAERRKSLKGAQEAEEGTSLRGPALTLDILAIYR